MNTLYVFDDLVVHSPGTVWDLRIFWQSTAGGVFSEASTAQFHKLSGTQEYFAGLQPWDRISAGYPFLPMDKFLPRHVPYYSMEGGGITILEFVESVTTVNH